MARGQPCRHKGCRHRQPCPDHTAKGKERKRSKRPGTVHELFPEDRKKQPSSVLRPQPGDPDHSVDGRRRRAFYPGKRWTEVHDEVMNGHYTWEEFAADLSPEELARAQLKNKNGGWSGRPPTWIPREFHNACQRELFRRFNERMQESLIDATNELIRLAMPGSEVDGKDRARILQYVIERVMGPVPKEVKVSAADPWEQIISGILSESDDVEPPRYVENRSQQGNSD